MGYAQQSSPSWNLDKLVYNSHYSLARMISRLGMIWELKSNKASNHWARESYPREWQKKLSCIFVAT